MSDDAVPMVQGVAEPPAVGGINSLIEMAVTKDFDLERLRQLIDLKNQEEERAAKKEFDYHFAKMQSEFGVAVRSKQAYGYKYAPIEALQVQFGPTIAQHGFAYRWTEKETEDGCKLVTLIISGWGHTDSSSTFKCPRLPSEKQLNEIQILGKMTTYGRRYTFISGFGLIIENEDDDAQKERGQDRGQAPASERPAAPPASTPAKDTPAAPPPEDLDAEARKARIASLIRQIADVVKPNGAEGAWTEGEKKIAKTGEGYLESTKAKWPDCAAMLEAILLRVKIGNLLKIKGLPDWEKRMGMVVAYGYDQDALRKYHDLVLYEIEKKPADPSAPEFKEQSEKLDIF
jgi:hypothetical protein